MNNSVMEESVLGSQVDDLSSIFGDYEVPEIKSNKEKMVLSSNDFPYTLSLYRKDFQEEKDQNYFIKSCVRMIRGCPEYKIWVSYLRNVLGKHVCEITKEINAETTVEIHHHPFTLYDITKVICMNYLSSNKEFCSFDIVKDVLLVHYENVVGYIPLISSMHEKFHNDCLNIPMEYVSGDWEIFKNRYISFLDDEDLEKINDRLSVTIESCGWGNNYCWTKNKYKGI